MSPTEVTRIGRFIKVAIEVLSVLLKIFISVPVMIGRKIASKK